MAVRVGKPGCIKYAIRYDQLLLTIKHNIWMVSAQILGTFNQPTCASFYTTESDTTMTSIADQRKGVPYVLYYNRFSICSLMMRWMIEIKGEPKDEGARMDIVPKEIDIFNQEQFTEWYLCDINPNGQVSSRDALCRGFPCKGEYFFS
jgi:hypothetical protein